MWRYTQAITEYLECLCLSTGLGPSSRSPVWLAWVELPHRY
ncbi:hypothetical protein Rhow_007812 [Rhodococcus wratislaviensis]|uniref:Uncharacterized protein n=1 Tax=Rhodococcus wratislaviensis TaxID=44752 RepID=A0A402CJ13_RHOWR|nr:hypothetical protein Rhow_007812 [Rhodococcus wratislaviensis]